MANRTPRFGFTTFDNPADSLALHGYKAFGADRELLDRLLTTAVERHTHTGATITTTPPAPPGLQLSFTGGVLPANQTVHYRTSLVDNHGQEHIASQTAVAYTPSQLTAPAPPIALRSTGTLPPGDYLYAVSAYTGDSQRETLASGTASSNLPGIGGFTLVMPRPPSGATGWNIYRKGPTEYELMHLATTALDDTVYADDGAVTASRGRTNPAINTSSSTSAITVDRPEGLDTGETLKIYRTFDPTDWEDSLLVWTGVLPYLDTGHPTRTGYPPTVSLGVGGAPQIDLAAHTTGSVPPGLTQTTTEINFTFLGPAEAGLGPWQWVNEYDELHLLALQAHLGRDATPAAESLIVALARRDAGEGVWLRYQDQLGPTDITAEIPVGESASATVPLLATNLPAALHPGDALRPVILQAGSGATPTDVNLAITVTATVAHGSATTTYTWET